MVQGSVHSCKFQAQKALTWEEVLESNINSYLGILSNSLNF
jgi:hypothetical protein